MAAVSEPSASISPQSTKPADVPQHLAIIMDGNGRWARERGMPRAEGHRAGAESVREATEACKELGIRFLTLYAFSSENWKRPQAEISMLMTLLERFLREKSKEMQQQNMRLQAIGQLDQLPPQTRARLEEAIRLTANNTGVTLILALAYGGREEIVEAARSLARDARAGKLDPDAIDADLFASRLYTTGIPDPDLLIRTSGEMRLSNFLLWQVSYAEIVVVRKFWPDFTKADVHEAVAEFSRRHRRFGAL
jgi:undecaprenyl diphosphate synthase